MGIPGSSGHEALVASAILDDLKRAGVRPSQVKHDTAQRRGPHGGERGNLAVHLPGTAGRTREARRLLMAHMDTVPICVGSKPIRRGGRIVSADKATGLGADNRAGCAAVLVAALELLENDLPHPPLTLLFTVQEEVGLVGARHLSRSLLGRPLPSMGFNFDGGDPAQVTVAAVGADRMSIEVEGIASHAGNHPERGVSAITIAGRAIAALDRAGWLGLVRKRAGRGTSNVGVIEGGQATNVVTPHATLRAEARSHDAAFCQQIVEAYREAFFKAAEGVHNEAGQAGRIRFDVRHDYDAFHLPGDEPTVLEACDAVNAAGYDPIHKVCNGGLDANWLNAHGVPTVTLGVGQQDIHTVNESLNVKWFLDGCRVALRLAAGENKRAENQENTK